MKGKRYKFMKGYNRNNIKLSIDEPMFFVNEKKRTVTCKLNGFLSGPCSYNEWMMAGINFPDKEYSITATAYCHENDVFDVERGKRIALSKAENGLYNKASLDVSNICERLDFLRDACNSVSEVSGA